MRVRIIPTAPSARRRTPCYGAGDRSARGTPSSRFDPFPSPLARLQAACTSRRLPKPSWPPADRGTISSNVASYCSRICSFGSSRSGKRWPQRAHRPRCFCMRYSRHSARVLASRNGFQLTSGDTADRTAQGSTRCVRALAGRLPRTTQLRRGSQPSRLH
jgi:hypothetical protein